MVTVGFGGSENDLEGWLNALYDFRKRPSTIKELASMLLAERGLGRYGDEDDPEAYEIAAGGFAGGDPMRHENQIDPDTDALAGGVVNEMPRSGPGSAPQQARAADDTVTDDEVRDTTDRIAFRLVHLYRNTEGGNLTQSQKAAEFKRQVDILGGGGLWMSVHTLRKLYNSQLIILRQYNGHNVDLIKRSIHNDIYDDIYKMLRSGEICLGSLEECQI